MICALTGHREFDEKTNESALLYALEDLIKEGYDFYRCGMAKGFDFAALKALIELKQKYPIQIEACIPYAGHEQRFPYPQREKYMEYLTWCDKIHVSYPNYCDGCFLSRDRYMVDGADITFAYCTRETGGTAYTVRYARKKGVPVKFFKAMEE